MTEKVTIGNAELYLGDCLDVMRSIKSGTIDSIVTDPPYGISYQSQWKRDESKRHKKIHGDSLPFIWFLYDAARVVVESGSLVSFCEWRHQNIFKDAIEASGLNIKSQAIWDRDWHGMGDLKASFAPCHDVIMLLLKWNCFVRFFGQTQTGRARMLCRNILFHVLCL